MGGRAKIVEVVSGSVTSTKQFVGSEERNASGAVTRQLFGRGEIISGTAYYFTFDHLGSIKEMSNASGIIQTTYGYDSYGRTTRLSGTVDADVQYAGMYAHAPSGLYLAMYRAYDPSLGIWIKKDPADDASYGYVGGNPISRTDPLGLYYEVSQTTVNGINFVDVHVPITFIGGPNKEALSSQYITEIYQTWNRRFGNVVLGVLITIDNSGRNVIDLCTKNQKGIKTTGFASDVEPGFGTLISTQSMFGFWAPTLEGRVAHEFGHILGLSHAAPVGNLMNDSPFLGTNLTAGQIQSIVNGSPYYHGLGYFK